MATTRISESTREVLRQLAASSGESMQAILEKAVEAYRRQRFLEECNRAFAALRADPAAWAVEERERQAWDGALADGLPEE